MCRPPPPELVEGGEKHHQAKKQQKVIFFRLSRSDPAGKPVPAFAGMTKKLDYRVSGVRS
ncbi:Uncharacterized protein dnm_005620 [Desulfonema magnum]|uniref:Uncharacterized protein n=1 Tax=Desulfonema magnum TaxID=45655 RepID=A0A975BG38_9BACT|nr:Uncharacterized protein dnm_005620 [Desulfonema magnum]